LPAVPFRATPGVSPLKSDARKTIGWATGRFHGRTVRIGHVP
jgi:hypothetical protein